MRSRLRRSGRWRSNHGFEAAARRASRWPETVRRSTLRCALLILEGGLSFEQAAALEWRDLEWTTSSELRSQSGQSRTSPPRSSQSPTERMTIWWRFAPDACEPDEKILSICAQQMANRTRTMLRIAGIRRSESLRTEQAESAGVRLLSETLDRNMFEALRATAPVPRLYGLCDGGLQWESHAAAQKRGRADIALLWVVQAAKLTISQAAALKWGDVEKRSEDETRLTVRSGAILRAVPMSVCSPGRRFAILRRCAVTLSLRTAYSGS